MPLFLTVDQIYRVIQRELPPDAYPDGAPGAFFSTADSYATAKQFADAYTNLQGIYNNYFPQTSDDRISDWEITVFGQVSSSGGSLADRQAAVLIKLQTRPGITPADMKAIVLELFPQIGSSNVNIIEWGQASGGWMLDESELGSQTFLSPSNGVSITPSLFPNVDICGAEIAEDPEAFGLTPQQLEDAQDTAYTYEVQIFNYTLTTMQRQALDTALTAGEPARSTHVITDGLTDDEKTIELLTEGGDIIETEDGNVIILEGP